MAITFVGSGTGQAANGGNVTVTLPGGMLQNDIVVVSLTQTHTPATATPATGYTLIGEQDQGATVSHWVGYKRMGAVPDTTVSCTGTTTGTDSESVVAMVFRGVDTTTAIDVVATKASASSGAPNAAAITPTTANCCIVATASGDAATASVGTITGYSTPVTTNSTDTRSSTNAVAYKVLSGGAGVSEDPAAFSNTWGSLWASVTVALRPAAAGPTLGTGSAAGTATVIGVGQARFQAVGSSSGASTTLGAGRARIRVVGASAGAAVASGVGRARTRSVGTSAGSAVAAAIVSAVRFRAVGISSGVAAVLGIGQVHVRATGLASGSSFVMGRPKGSASGSSDGAATVLGVGRARTRVVGAASGTGAALGVGRARIRSIGAASGAGTAAGFKPAASPPSFSIAFIIG